jgi:hypothetical protein
MYKRTIISGIANDLEPQPRFYALLRIAMVCPSEPHTMSDTQRSTKHMLITFSGD